MYEEFENKTAEEIIEWALKEFKDKISLACSFGAEDVLLVDMVYKIGRKTGIVPKIFTIDTGRLPQETYDVMEKIMDKYKLKIDFFFHEAEEIEKIES